MTKSDILAEMRRLFVQKYDPPPDSFYTSDQFEIDLDRLIYTAFAVAQEPFVQEFNSIKDNLVQSQLLQPNPILPPYYRR